MYSAMCIDPACFAVSPNLIMRIGKVASSVTLALSMAAAVVISDSAPASAILLETANGERFDVIVEETTFDDLSARSDFSSLMPWYVDENDDDERNDDLAKALAIAASDAFNDENSSDLGLPYNNFFGPIFAFGRISNGSVEFTTYVNDTGFLLGDDTIANPGLIFPYAIVNPNSTTAIPTPALLPGLVGMGLAAIRKRQLTETDESI